MDIETPEDPEENAEFLHSVERQFQTAVNIFQDMLDRTSEGKSFSKTEVTATGRALFDAAQALILQKNRIYDERKRQEGVAHAYALDLDAARDTVGRLLDRLRAAGGTDDVPR